MKVRIIQPTGDNSIAVVDQFGSIWHGNTNDLIIVTPQTKDDEKHK